MFETSAFEGSRSASASTWVFCRNDQYAQAWQTLSPATRRRLERYINQPQLQSLTDPYFEQEAEAQRREQLNRKRAVWRKRSYSADEEIDARNRCYDPNRLGFFSGHPAAVPRIRESSPAPA